MGDFVEVAPVGLLGIGGESGKKVRRKWRNVWVKVEEFKKRRKFKRSWLPCRI